MLFNSLAFIVFLVIVFSGYWALNKCNLKWQNLFLLIASLVFYGFWDWRFLFLLLFSTFLDYYSGLKIFRAAETTLKKTWLVISITTNLAFLGFFKYYDFFAESFAELLSLFHFRIDPFLLGVVLPVGISFYTFHGLSYVIDIYRGKIEPSTNVINYSLFVSFFPLLVAGPIERATHLLPQIEQRRRFSTAKATDGLRQMLFGFFKKVVIADGCAEYVDIVFGNYQHYSGVVLFIAAVLFAVQIYCDFSGYTDIALGVARLFGFELIRNFNYPYFARSLGDFWRRWHISLTTWFRDYVYFALGGNRSGVVKTIRNVFIIFLVSGFWHGANWTFICWGALNALFYIPSVIRPKSSSRNSDEESFNLKALLEMIGTFLLVTFLWIFFRSATIGQSIGYISRIFSSSFLDKGWGGYYELSSARYLWIFIPLLFIVEWFGRDQEFALQKLFTGSPRLVRWSVYAVLLFCIGMFMQTKETAFIYFQF